MQKIDLIFRKCFMGRDPGVNFRVRAGSAEGDQGLKDWEHKVNMAGNRRLYREAHLAFDYLGSSHNPVATPLGLAPTTRNISRFLGA